MNREERKKLVSDLRDQAEGVTVSHPLDINQSFVANLLTGAADEIERLSPSRDLVEDIAVFGLRDGMLPSSYSRDVIVSHYDNSINELKDRTRMAMRNG